MVALVIEGSKWLLSRELLNTCNKYSKLQSAFCLYNQEAVCTWSLAIKKRAGCQLALSGASSHFLLESQSYNNLILFKYS